MKIQNKLFMTIAPLFLIGIVLLTSIAYQVAERSIVRQVRESKQLILQQVSEKLEAINQNMLSVSNIYFLDSKIRDWLRNDDRSSEYEKYKSLAEVNDAVNQTGNYFKHLKYTTAFIGFNGISYSSSADEQGDYDFAQELKMTREITDINKMHWSDTYLHHGKYVFSAMRYLRDVYTGEDLGLLILDFEERVLFDAYKNLTGINLMIMNADGGVLSDRDQAMIGESFGDDSFFRKLQPYEKGSFMMEDEGAKSLVTFRKVPSMNWYLVERIPLSILLKDMNNVRELIFLSAFGILIALFALTYYFSYRISSPLKRLVRSMQQAQSGDFKMLVTVDRKDEIGILMKKYNTMLMRIAQLLVEVQNENELKRKAEIQALQSQINPHFLYNTLNSIRWMAKINNTGMVNKMIISLVRLLRQSLSQGQEWIAFDEELKFLEDYILIQKVRYGDKFDVIFDIEEDVRACMTVKLLIQPLLENAIFHGIEPKDGNGMIRVEARMQGGQIMVSIEDDGVGMDPDKGRNGLGIRSAEQRIKLHFGEKYGLKVDSRIGTGTRVTLWIPVIKENR
ncbi:cache domain-containing sensor histidine kinase [Paenibacillus nasutitermitis]|uniref:histidine kinase n=1 Tax=Paenibacillus nasutitermitis TaxID=1652958 RepID=A0A916ZFC3_9BACL|nr:sensor histidine kinase [Paenibacillus nasutitermitis]GGD93900.1 histidine kinase [Paenibacillus nasutitermitis]